VVTALGDGSDFTAFQDLAGISTLSIEFGGEDDGTQYHSIYDDFYWYTHFVDTDFAYGRALAKTVGTAMMRLADADLIPFDHSPQAEAIGKYETDLEKLLKDKRDEFIERNLQLQEGVFTATADPRRPTVPPPAETVPPYMNFAPMKNAIELLKKSSERYSRMLAAWRTQGSRAVSVQSLDTVNADLLRIPRLFLDEKGLPERPWFKNQIYAPGAQIPQVAQVIENAAAGIDRAAADLENALLR
jgi:N-acetylated-alpha-linked acidic dipeptidase